MGGGSDARWKGQPAKGHLCRGDRREVIKPRTQFHKSTHRLLASLLILESFAFFKKDREREWQNYVQEKGEIPCTKGLLLLNIRAIHHYTYKCM